MSKIVSGIFLFSFFISLFPPLQGAAPQKDPLVYQQYKNPKYATREKIRFIRAVVYSFRLQDLTNLDVEKKVYDTIGKQLPLDPTAPFDGRTEAELKKIVQDSLDAPQKQERLAAEKNALKIAESRFKLFKKNDNVKIHYRRGSRVYTATGKFYGQFGHLVFIGSQHISYNDIAEVDQVRINPEFSAKKKKEFIKAEVNRQLYKERAGYEKKLYALKEKQEADNLKHGFFPFGGQWYTVRKFAAMQVLAEQRKQIAEKKKFTPALAALHIKIEKIKEKLARAKGVDREPGIDLIAFWGFTREETRLAIQFEYRIKIQEKGNMDIIQSSDRETEFTQLEYGPDQKLCSVKIFFTNKTRDHARQLKADYTQKFGKDDASKIRKKEDPEPDDTDPVIWTGKTTAAKLIQKWQGGKMTVLSLEKTALSTINAPDKTAPAKK